MKKTIERISKQLKRPVKVAQVVDAPQVVRYQLVPQDNARGTPTRYTHIKNLLPDFQLRLGVAGVSLTQNGRMWLEVAKEYPDWVWGREIWEKPWLLDDHDLPILLGKDTDNQWLSFDLASATTPHLLIAGATGSGKSVCMSTILTALITSRSWDHVGLAMIDPKLVELAQFEAIDHLIQPIAYNVPDAFKLLRWAREEAQDRYEWMQKKGFRNASQTDLPRILIVVDELVDLMQGSTRDFNTEKVVASIAQVGRAAGVHLVLATQRPSADVVTPLITANITTRIAFSVANHYNSKIILDNTGAENLLGRGDGMFLKQGEVTRFQGAIFTDDEIKHAIELNTTAPKKQFFTPGGAYLSNDRQILKQVLLFFGKILLWILKVLWGIVYMIGSFLVGFIRG